MTSPEPREPQRPRWPTHMGRFSVPPRLFNAAPLWMHHAANWLVGVHPSLWVELRDRVVFFVRRVLRMDRRG